ncbi:hypothetical protein [Trichocoleus sp. FACHB-262]|uniref:hypothetical protein n=1 Tax=Trichocoleus sp. FACHB-262 TaxID=2692869 RepID=UPI001687C3C5|nr:hypothetical protein [Trichocoleus sp. FACHB-262]MBD2122859.1 hypothetical protein [Trichocoleus sp. FACHB-262]
MSKNNKNSSVDNLVFERRVGLLLGCLVIISFIVLIFYPQSFNNTTSAVIRFLAAFTAGVSAYLFSGTLNLEAKIPFNETQIRATGAFAAFLAVFLLFFNGISTPNSDNSNQLIETLPNGKYFYGVASTPNEKQARYIIFQKTGPVIEGITYFNKPGDNLACLTGLLSSSSIVEGTYIDYAESMGDENAKLAF